MADIAILASAVHNAPLDYTVPGAQEILLKAVGCTVTGTNAAGDFVPALQLIDPAGHVMWTAVNESRPIAAGRSALVSWFPGGGVDSVAATSSTTVTQGSGITEVTSPTGTLAVTNPLGPVTDVDMPATGVAAGTYGDATHVGSFTVDAEGRLSAASSTAISGSGGAGGLITIYDSGYLGADTATIDTGAGGIASGHFALYIVGYFRTDAAVANDNLVALWNNDSGANYDMIRTLSVGGTAAPIVATFLAQNSLLVGVCPGANDTANEFGSIWATVPAYDGTSNKKSGRFETDAMDQASTNSVSTIIGFNYRSTSALSRFAISSQTGGAKIKAGSRLVIYGTQ